MVSTLIELQAYRGNTKANGESLETRRIVKRNEKNQKPLTPKTMSFFKIDTFLVS